MTTEITTTACSGPTMISSSQQHENFPDVVPCSPPHSFNSVTIILDEDDDESSITSSITYNNEDSITYSNEDSTTSKGVMPSTGDESTTTKSTNISKHVDMFEYSNYLRTDCRDPVHLNYCPCCKKPDVMTTTKSQSTSTTAGLVCVGLLIFWPLAWMPLVAKSNKRIHHHCSNCNVLVGQVQPTLMS